MDRRLIACCGAAALGAGVACYLLWPGTMNVDAFIQLEEGRTGLFYGWHPPLMGWLWSRLERVISGPGVMLLLHHLMFWPGLGLVVYHLQRSPAVSATLVLGIGALPPVLSALGTIWKDVGMGAAFLIAFGLLLHVHRRHSVLWLVPAVAAIFYAVAIRHNAVFAALPLCLWLGHLMIRRVVPGARPARLIAAVLGLGTLAVMSGFNWIITTRLVDDRRTYPAHQVMLHDLIGISVRIGSVVVPSFYADTALPLSGIACVYAPHNAVMPFSGFYGGCPITLRKLTRAKEVSELRTAWLAEVRKHPRAYAAHRWAFWREQLGLGIERVHYPLEAGVPGPNKLGIDTRLTQRQERAQQLFVLAAYDTPLYRGWLYLLISIGVLVVGIRRSSDPVPLVVLTSSAVLYELGYIVIGTAADFRFNWWPIVAALVAMAMVVPPQRLREPARS